MSRRFNNYSNYSTGGNNSQRQVVYTDGACAGNGYDGARGGVGVYWGPNDQRNVSRPLEGRQTNQRAELEAAKTALQQAEERGVRDLEIRTDSKYVIESSTNWANNWQQNGWKNAHGRDVANQDLIRDIVDRSGRTNVEWVHVPGHKGDHGNQRADQLARQGARK